MADHQDEVFGDFLGTKLDRVTRNNVSLRFLPYVQEALADAGEDHEGWGVIVEPDEEDPTRLNVAPDLPERLRTKPQHEHDCDECRFVSVALLPHSSDIRDYQDIYLCNKAGYTTVIVRYGPGPDYTTVMLMGLAHSSNPLWSAVYKELNRRGHVGVLVRPGPE